MLTYLQCLPRELRDELYNYQDWNHLDKYQKREIFSYHFHMEAIRRIFFRTHTFYYWLKFWPSIEIDRWPYDLIVNITTNRQLHDELRFMCKQTKHTNVTVYKYKTPIANHDVELLKNIKENLTIITDIDQYEHNGEYLVEFGLKFLILARNKKQFIFIKESGQFRK